MPFYTFHCNSCGKKFEVRCTIAEKDSGSVVCPGCGASELDRIFEGFSVVSGKSACEGACPASTGSCPTRQAQGGGCGGCCGHGH